MAAFVDRPDGARIAFEVAGDPRRPAVMLLGGIGGDAPTWRHVVPLLATELFVITVDHRGIGRSDATETTTTIATYAEDAVAVLDELRLSAAHVYGHSFGTLVALELALAHPDRVLALVLGAGRPGRAGSVPGRGRAPLGRPWEVLYAPRFLERCPEVVDADRRATARRPDGERRQSEAAKAWTADGLGEIRASVLIVHGTDDLVVDVANAARLRERLPGAELALLEGAGHAYHSEMPERSTEIVLDFLRRHRSRA